ncbi:hypothetical protein V2J09_012739 [Rumex salicifolius]
MLFRDWIVKHVFWQNIISCLLIKLVHLLKVHLFLYILISKGLIKFPVLEAAYISLSYFDFFFLKSKDMVYRTLVDFLAYVKNQFAVSVKAVRSDNGTEIMPSSILSWKTPFDVLLKKQPTYDSLHAIGCLCYALYNPHDKFASKVRRCIFKDYSNAQKAYKLYHFDTHQSFVSRDVIFKENQFSFHPSFQDTSSFSPPYPVTSSSPLPLGEPIEDYLAIVSPPSPTLLDTSQPTL